MLSCEHVSLNIDGKNILDDVSFTISDAEFVVITGPNGGGKSTLAKTIAGIEKPTAGKMMLDDTDITDMSITERARLGIGFAFQQPVRFKGLTVRDLLAAAKGSPATEMELRDILHEVGLCARDYLDRELDASLSGGEAKRIEIAMMLLRDSRFLIFDEPEAGIDIWSFTNLINVFERLRQRHDRSIVVISHQERILNIADRIMLLSDGRIAANGEREKLLPDILSGRACCNFCPHQKEGC
jgi:Fe-S cluster assembly ATP-binding protein